MLNGLLKAGLSLGLIMSLSNAQMFKKGDTVIVPKGTMLCYSISAKAAFHGLDGVMLALWDYEDGNEEDQFPQIDSSSFINSEDEITCSVFSSDNQYKFDSYDELTKGRLVLLDSEDYWITTYSSSLKKAP